MHAIRDALNLANSIGTIGTGDRSHIRYALASYQKEMVARGVDAVRRSRGEIRADRKAEDVFMIWGHPAKPTPEEIVKLEDWL